MTKPAPTASVTANPHPLLSPGSILSLWGEAVDLLLKENNGEAALLYLQILRNHNLDLPQWDRAKIQANQDTLSALGLLPQDLLAEIAPPAPPPKVVPLAPSNYSKADIAQALSDKAGTFRQLCDQVEQRLGKVLNEADVERLLRLRNDGNLPESVLLLLVEWCIGEQQRKSGPGRMPTVYQINQAGNKWITLGIDTLESADRHIHRLELYHKKEREVARYMQISNRDFVKTEKDFVIQWLDWGFDSDAIGHAYELTVVQKGQMNWNYCNGILKSWQQLGLRTLAQVKVGDQNFAPRPKRTGGQAPGRVSRGPSASDTMAGSAQQAPSPAHSQRILEDRERARRQLLEDRQ